MTDEAAPRRSGRRASLDIPRGGWLPVLSLTRPVTVTMAFFALIVLGVISYRGIPLELVPSGFTPPFLFVQIPTLRSSPEDVEARIAIPAEDMFSTLRNLEQLGTRVRGNSASFIMQFSDGTDMDVAYNQVRDRIERLLPRLGDDIGQYFIWKYNPADDPVVWFAVTVDPSVDDPGRIIEERVVPRLERIAGVSRVEVSGAPRRVVVIEVDDRLAESAGTSMAELVTQLSQDNFAVSGGTIDDSGRRYPVRVTARYHSVDDIRRVAVGRTGLTIGDIAEVRVEDRRERAILRVNQRPSMFLEIYKESSENTVEVTERVRTTLEVELRGDERLEGVDFHYFADQGAIIKESLGNLQTTAVWGGFFAVLVLTFFLRDMRMTLVTTLAIPMSLLATLVVMYFAGRTLNVLSLAGFMLAVGLVVDNAIVVVESIQRRYNLGETRFMASLHGAADVGLAIVVATSTTVVVFVPMILMSGNEMLSFYLSQIGLPVCAALLCSLVVSLVFLPLMTSRVLARGDGSARVVPRMRLLTWVESRYAGLLALALRRRMDFVIIGVVAFASMSYPMKHVATTDQTTPNINDFQIYLQTSDQLTFEEQEAALFAYEGILWAHRDELGIENLLIRHAPGRGRPRLQCFLRPSDQRTLDRDATIELAMSLLPPRPGVELSLTWRAATDPQNTTVRVSGPDSRRLADMSEEVAARLRGIEGVTSVTTEAGDDGQTELHFHVDRERALRLGLSPMVVGGSLDFALRGRELPSLRTDLAEFPVYVQGDISRINELDEVGQLEMPGTEERVTLGSVSTYRVTPGFRGIDRQNRRTVVSITIVTSREDIGGLRGDINRVMRGYDWPRGYGLEFGERFTALDQGQDDRKFAVILAITFVFLLMGVLFESFILPFSIVLAIPFAFVGVYWFLFATGTSFDTMAGVGLIILIGIVVNNAIVYVDRVESLRRDGTAREIALVEAGRERLRPIVMTALTTIFGLVPMALGDAALVGIPYAPMGIAVIGGLIASTVLTLVIVPVSYTLFDDLRVAIARAFSVYPPGTPPPTD